MVAITPVAKGRCLQHTAICQNFPFLNQNREEDVRNLLMEDVAAMESIQSLLDTLDPELHREVSVHADTPAMRMRKEIQRMLESESTR